MVEIQKLFCNKVVDKKQLKKIMSWAFDEFGIRKASYLANELKDLGFNYATQAGLSISIEDLRVPPIKSKLIKLASEKVSLADFEVNRGEITEVERFQKVINTWNTTSESLKDQVVSYFKQSDPLNSIYMMAFSGARGNLSQVRQLVGMRGLMADPNGQIIDLPIVTNFREGLTVTDYIISSYGARKGLVDTALRTADSGYLTRRLVDVAQDVVTRQKNCKTKDGISLRKVGDGKNLLISLKDRAIGRLLALPLKDSKTNKEFATVDEMITLQIAQAIEKNQILKVVVRSPLTCSSSRSICQQCYGWNLAYKRLIDLGEAVGIIAAQSIGEPGTQLTMRTFHTGGVFTTEPSRQIRADFSGKIEFSPRLKVKKTRTQYGENAFISENKSSLSLTTYGNQKISIEILPETLILVKTNTYVKKDDVLFEIISPTKQTGGEKAYKSVYASLSGEVVLENKNTNLKETNFFDGSITSTQSTSLLWILAGQVYNVPLKSMLQVKAQKKIRKDQTLAEAKVISTTGGRVKLTQKKKDFDIVHSSDSLKNVNLYLEQSPKTLQKPVVYGSKNRRIYIDSLSVMKLVDDASPNLGRLINLSYKTRTGGIFYSKAFHNKKESFNFSERRTKPGGSIFYIPESTYQINKDTTQVYIQNGENISLGTEIFKNKFTCTSGIVDISEQKKIVKEISIKPGRNLLMKKEKGLRSLHQKVIYPGEILFGNIKIKQLSFSEVKTLHGKTFLRLYPIVRYEITNDPNELSYFLDAKLTTNKDIYISPLETGFPFENKVKTSSPLQIVEAAISCQPLSASKNFKVNLDLVSKLSVRKKLKLNIQILENISVAQYLPNELKKANISIISLIDNHQYVEPYTKLSSFQVLIPEKNLLLKIKEQFLGKERKVYLTTQNDFKKVFMEDTNSGLKRNNFIKLKEKTKTSFLSKESGLISEIIGSSFLIQKAQAYLFSEGAIIKRRPGDLIKKGEGLGQLVYERARTGDIVQGLPRVEEILEGRKPKTEANLARYPGIITEIDAKQAKTTIWIFSPWTLLYSPKQIPRTQSLLESQRLLIGQFEFINVGQALNDAPINPHTILETYFTYYTYLGLLTPYLAAYRSLRKVQALLLNSVQAVYYSQGVNISDKHVEIIIKQMTGKVQVTNSRNSNLLIDEIIDLRKAYYINRCLGKKEDALFTPVLFGITKASLSTNSFISAASFQQTTRVLTEAAIQGKTDWLRGLKENVIVGRLIPTGTGFNAYSDISYISVKVPASISKTQVPFEKRTKKYMELKNKIKFKIIS
jgi:DNA-directed RNA polymerase subunit beta'